MQLGPAAPLVTARRDDGWVTKTDVTTYLRCPFTYSLLWRGEITRDEIVDEATRELLAEGVAFHEQVDQSVPPIEVGSPEELQALFAAGVTLYHTPIYQNSDLMIVGQPDGIDPAEGLMVPIEFKMHKEVSVYDELELAFYWLLLAPQRKRNDQPRGIVVLRREGMPVSVDVMIAPNRLRRVVELLGLVRAARKEPVAPRICGCNVCTKVRREEVRTYAAEHKDLTMLLGIARTVAEALEAAGVADYEDLAERDLEELVDQLRAAGLRCSLEQVMRWQFHARAYQEGRAQFFGEVLPVGENFIALDLEYRTPPFGDMLWLAGVSVVRQDRADVYQFLADDDTLASEKLAVAYLAEILGKHHDLPVVTWNGKAADCPVLRKAAARCGVADPMEGMRHEDLFAYATKSLRLPTPSTKLKELADYFAIPRLEDVGGGLHAQLLFRQLLTTTDQRERQRLQEDLLHYNQDDLSVLVAITDELREMSVELPAPS
jgi:predicted RecB family nuclease